MQIEEFEELVQEALGDIPDKYRKVLREEKIEILPRENAPLVESYKLLDGFKVNCVSQWTSVEAPPEYDLLRTENFCHRKCLFNACLTNFEVSTTE